MYSIICRRHAVFQDIILRGEEGIQKRITTEMNEAKCHFLGLVAIRFFVVYEDPRISDSEETKEFMAEHECVVIYCSCSIINKQYEKGNKYQNGDKYPNVTKCNMCYGL